MAIIDFLYFGEANVCQENLDSFLLIAEELKLKGLTGLNSEDLVNTQEKFVKSVPQNKEKPNHSMTAYEEPLGKDSTSKDRVDDTGSRALAVPGKFPTDLLALDEKVKSMMTKSQNMIPNSHRANGAPKQTKAMICNVCQKEGQPSHIRDHIEANHLEGIIIPCNFCDKVLNSRNQVAYHKSRKHKNLN